MRHEYACVSMNLLNFKLFFPLSDLKFRHSGCDIMDYINKIIGETSILMEIHGFQNAFVGEEEATSRIQEGIISNCSTSLSDCQGSIGRNLVQNAITEDNVTSNKKGPGRRKGKQTKKNDNVSTRRKGKVEVKRENPVDWDELRRTYSSGKRNHGSTMDSVDWEKVRDASDEEISSIIAQRGMHNVIGKRIKVNLNSSIYSKNLL